jgi:hypothetical protein
MTSFPNIRIRIFQPGNKRSIRKLFRAPAGHLYTSHGIQKQLEHTAKQIEQNHPGEEYKLVELGPAEFSFVWVRKIEAAAS